MNAQRTPCSLPPPSPAGGAFGSGILTKTRMARSGKSTETLSRRTNRSKWRCIQPGESRWKTVISGSTETWSVFSTRKYKRGAALSDKNGLSITALSAKHLRLASVKGQGSNRTNESPYISARNNGTTTGLRAGTRTQVPMDTWLYCTVGILRATLRPHHSSHLWEAPQPLGQ
jgi:hypothetical protein